VIFDCDALLFEGGKCEWTVIQGFVSVYNSLNITAYEVAACLDVVDRTSPQPEVRLVCPGAIDMVVERKSIVWPKNHIPDHRRFHEFAEAFVARMERNALLSQSMLCISEVSLRERIDITHAVETICDALDRGEIAGKMPFRWQLVPAAALGYSEEEVQGIDVECIGSQDLDLLDPEAIRKRSSKAHEGFEEECYRALRAAAKKFETYRDLLRVVLLQFVGHETFLDDRNIEELVTTCADANAHDEIWVAVHDWINKDEYRLDWRKVWYRGKLK